MLALPAMRINASSSRMDRAEQTRGPASRRVARRRREGQAGLLVGGEPFLDCGPAVDALTARPLRVLLRATRPGQVDQSPPAVFGPVEDIVAIQAPSDCRDPDAGEQMAGTALGGNLCLQGTALIREISET